MRLSRVRVLQLGVLKCACANWWACLECLELLGRGGAGASLKRARWSNALARDYRNSCIPICCLFEFEFDCSVTIKRSKIQISDTGEIHRLIALKTFYLRRLCLQVCVLSAVVFVRQARIRLCCRLLQYLAFTLSFIGHGLLR